MFSTLFIVCPLGSAGCESVVMLLSRGSRCAAHLGVLSRGLPVIGLSCTLVPFWEGQLFPLCRLVCSSCQPLNSRLIRQMLHSSASDFRALFSDFFRVYRVPDHLSLFAVRVFVLFCLHIDFGFMILMLRVGCDV